MINALKKTLFLLVILIIAICNIYATSAENGTAILINEIMSSNLTTIQDEDGDYPDWIEIFNHGTTHVNLTGYGLTDNENDLFKWIFPDCILNPGQLKLVFASGKNRINVPSHWETVINQGDEWMYFVGNSEPHENWDAVGFDDSGWPSDPSGIGYGDDDDATIIQHTVSLYLRKSFNIDEISNITHCTLNIDYDDAFVAYINGIEIARANIGEIGIRPPYDQRAYEHRESLMYTGGQPETYEIDSIQTLLISGENVLAIQVHNNIIRSSDMTVIPFLTLGMTIPPSNPIGVPDILKFYIKCLHTNFKIKSSGETVILTDSSGTQIDRLETGMIPVDHSLGRFPDGGETWIISTKPTPGENNNDNRLPGFADTVWASIPGGFYSDTLSVELFVNSPSAVIHYTLDGSDPSDSSLIYIHPIHVDTITVIRARAFEEDYLPGRIFTQTYFINQNISISVISLATNPANFFDDEIGIYVMGNNANPNWPYWNSNFRQDWERPVHIEFYEPDGNLGFSIDAGVKIQGGYTRGYPQKSLAIYARSRYGYSQINYQIFPDLPITEFEAIILRNSSNDFLSGLIRDPLMHSLGDDIGLDVQAYRPAVVFINGTYWGIHNVREKQNEHYLSSHYDVDPDNLDRIAINGVVQQGDNVQYNSIVDYVTNNSLSVSENYEYVKTHVDVDNLIDYNVAEIYFANNDWPYNNNDCWRPRTPDGKWRWLLYDTDMGFGVNDPLLQGEDPFDPLFTGETIVNMYTHNTLEIATIYMRRPPEPMLSALLLSKLLNNERFKYDFINRFADYSNTVFHPDHVIQIVHEMKDVLELEIPKHFERWRWREDISGYPYSGYPYSLFGDTIEDWYNSLQRIEEFATNRLPYVRSHFISKFGLSGIALLDLNVSDTQAGKIKINSRTIEEYPWDGQYFKDIPLQLTALPNPGYKFAGWTGISPTDSISTTIVLSESIAVTALFEQDEGPFGPIVINEINYNSSDTFNPDDWIELYNNSGSSVDLSGWRCMDEDDTHFYDLPPGTVIGAGQFLVLCRDSQAFTSFFPLVDNYIGDLGFGLSGGGELIRLLDSQGTIIDSLTFDDAAPWPVEPDGNGPTLALINPDTNNSIPLNWAASLYHGTPGKVNDVISGVDVVLQNVPRQFSLDQNFPNPFNPFTAIRFGLPRECDVTIEVFNILGQRVATLQDGNKPAGYYTVHFDGSVVSSGVYYYRMKAGAFNSVKKMLLVK